MGLALRLLKQSPVHYLSSDGVDGGWWEEGTGGAKFWPSLPLPIHSLRLLPSPQFTSVELSMRKVILPLNTTIKCV